MQFHLLFLGRLNFDKVPDVKQHAANRRRVLVNNGLADLPQAKRGAGLAVARNVADCAFDELNLQLHFLQLPLLS